MRPTPARASPWLNAAALAAVVVSAVLVIVKNVGAKNVEGAFLNVSYDPTRELYREINKGFLRGYTGRALPIEQSHGGSASQSRAVADGLAADVVTLAMHSDVDALRKRGLIAADWSARLPNQSVPYTSTIVFVVRKGNPARIHDWQDLVRPGVSIVTPNPKTSGNGRLSFLAAWGAILRRGGDDEAARAYVSRLYEHVVSLDGGARAATAAFAHERLGDVQLTWENEALLEVDESGGDLELMYPPVSIRAEPCVAWVDANVERKGTLAQAKAYLSFLYSGEGQELIANHGYRPVDAEVLARHSKQFPPIDLFAVTLVAPSWLAAEERFFSEDGVFDVMSKSKSR